MHICQTRANSQGRWSQVGKAGTNNQQSRDRIRRALSRTDVDDATD